MKEYSLTIIFNKTKDALLVCYNQKLGKYNFVGGKKEPDDRYWLDTAYRELEEETGITRGDVTLYFIRKERVTTWDSVDWNMTVSAGILEKDIELVEGENKLYWLPIKGIKRLLDDEFMGDGNCYTFYIESCKMLGLDYKSVYGSINDYCSCILEPVKMS